MATKVAYTLREDKQELQKQLGCMNGIFQLFDRRYLLGLHRHGRNQNRLTLGNGEKDVKNSSEKAKEKNPKVMIEKNRASVESSRNSFSSSCSTTTFSSLDCSKRVQTEWQLPSEPVSPNLHKKQPDWSLQPPDFRDLIKGSMIREVCVAKDEQAGPVMKHVDSPRPFLHQISAQYERKDRNLAKVQKTSSRFSCDERESQYSLKSTLKVKELPRLSLDSKQNSNKNSMNRLRNSQTLNESHEPGSNKRPSSGVVARLMGLEGLTVSVCDVETLKIKPCLDDGLVLSSRWSRNGEEIKPNHGSVSPRVHKKLAPENPAFKNKEAPVRANNGPSSVYGEMEKRLSALEFKTSGKDLRALKQILEAMQATRTVTPINQKSDQPVSPTIKGTRSPKRLEPLNRAVKPVKTTTDLTVHKVNHATKNHVKDPTPRNKKATSRTPRSLSPSNAPDYISSPRLQRSKNGVEKPCFHGPSSDSRRNKKIRNPKAKSIDSMHNNEKSCKHSIETRNLRQYGDKVSQNKLEVIRNDLPKKNQRVNENTFGERSVEDKPMVEFAKLTMEQPSPVSVLDAFYTEDTPSPVKKKLNAFNDDENLHFDETERNQVGNYNLENITDRDQDSEFNRVKLENRNRLIRQIELLNSTADEVTINTTAASPRKSTNGDHKYINEILLASGFLNDLDSAIRMVQLHPTASLINPELFHLLEETEGCTELGDDERHKKHSRSKSNEKIRRQMIFDSVNDILFHKLTVSGISGLWTGKKTGRLPNGEKLLKELCSEIDNLQTSSERCIFDEDDEVKTLVSADVNKKSEGWDECCYEVPGLVLDIERLIFKDLIGELVNAGVTSLQDRPERHCRRLFPM